MTPEVYYIELHLAQVEDELSRINIKVANGLYNSLVEDYISYLNAVVIELRKIDLGTQTNNDKCQLRLILQFVASCIQYLKSATKEDLRYSLYVFLRAAMEDWVKESPQKYVITSYKADISSHHFLSFTSNRQIIRVIKDVLGIDIPYKLVSLGYPTYLEKDFLSNVSLYHELGHFVDQCEWSISQEISMYFINHGIPLHDKYFKNIEPQIITDKSNRCFLPEFLKLNRMLSEYFADIFAVQYIGRHKHHLPLYFAGDNDFSDSHPSTAARIQAIENFLQPENLHDDFIKALRHETLLITGKELKIRNAPLASDTLLLGKPYNDLNKDQLHSLLQNAWELWETDKSGFRSNPDIM